MLSFVNGAIFTELGCCDFHLRVVILRYVVRSSHEKSTYPVPGSSFNYHGPPKPTCLEAFMVNNLDFRWPKPLFFMVLVAHGIYCTRSRCFFPKMPGPA